MTLDGVAGDGEAGERDDVRSSVDDLIGGAGPDRLVGSDWPQRLVGGAGDDRLEGRGKDDVLEGGPGRDLLIGGAGTDVLEGGEDDDHLSGVDATAEALRCGAGKDVAVLDRADRPEGCETRKVRTPEQLAKPAAATPKGTTSRAVGVRRVRSRGRIVRIPGHPGERLDSRLLADLRWIAARFKVRVTDGFALHGHAPGGEHPIGAAVDLVPAANGSWDDVDRLARWAEPRQGRPRRPFRWVGYDGDARHGRGHHLHLSWRHGPARRGRAASWVERLVLRTPATRLAGGTVRKGSLLALGRRTNRGLGGAPRVRTGLRSLPRCGGADQLRPTWQAAARAFGLRWSVLAAITEVESAHGCTMGPSSAGAIGWTQFLPSTWRMYGMDADGDGKASPYSSADAIFSTARYLRASGAPRSYRRALFAYNHAGWYVDKVLRRAKAYR